MLTATLINYLHLCHRKLWLHAHYIRMEHTSDTVYEGKLLHEQTYGRRTGAYREIQLPGGKIDYYDPKNKVIHETKKSPKRSDAHVAQLKYYLWLLEQEGIAGATGKLEYPSQKRTEIVTLTPIDRKEIHQWRAEAIRIIDSPTCPALLKKSQCRGCSYLDFCWAGEFEAD